MSERTIDGCLKELEEVLGLMNEEGIELEKSFELYKKGTYLIRECQEKISSIEHKLEILEKDDQE